MHCVPTNKIRNRQVHTPWTIAAVVRDLSDREHNIMYEGERSY